MRTLLVLVSVFIFSCIHAQEEATPSILRVDTTAVDQRPTPKIKLKDDFIPVPKKALIYSLVLPGAGQIYNRKYWKLPLVYGAYGGLVYAFDFNGGTYKRYKKALEYRLDEDPTTDPTEIIPAAISDTALRSARDNARKNLELTYMATIVVHALNGIEAFVDAHLRNFDVSEDLSLSIRPTFETNATGIQSGIGLFVTF